MSASLPVDILLVEDDPQDLKLVLRALAKAAVSNRVQIARDGAEALDFLFCEGTHTQRSIEDTPKVILLDLKLPKVDGLEVIQRVKGDVRTRSTPVVVLTSSQEQSDILKSYQLGANSYIVKPVNFEGYADAVHKLGKYWLVHNQSPHLRH